MSLEGTSEHCRQAGREGGRKAKVTQEERERGIQETFTNARR